MPILPMVLVNGAEGIGTGWSTSIPNYNPRHVAANLQRYLAGQPLEPMQPWCASYSGHSIKPCRTRMCHILFEWSLPNRHAGVLPDGDALCGFIC